MDDHEGALERAEAELRDWLVAHGATIEQVEMLEREGHAEGLASDLVLSRDATLSARDLANRSGLDVDVILAIYRDFGISVPDPNAPSSAPTTSRLSLNSPRSPRAVSPRARSC